MSGKHQKSEFVKILDMHPGAQKPTPGLPQLSGSSSSDDFIVIKLYLNIYECISIGFQAAHGWPPATYLHTSVFEYYLFLINYRKRFNKFHRLSLILKIYL
jgi:hypothetical protein